MASSKFCRYFHSTKCFRIVGRVVGVPEFCGLFVASERFWNGINVLLFGHRSTFFQIWSYHARRLEEPRSFACEQTIPANIRRHPSVRMRCTNLHLERVLSQQAEHAEW